MRRPTGWAAIQKDMFSHDCDVIEDFGDDVDTLLVFAGLFSAVVTAFVIVSYTMLQPDTTQQSIQLLSVLAIRSGGFPGSDSFLNSTAATLPSSTAFQAPTSAITINALWFASLVLSLASALYGILAKQWCREYIKWKYVLADARENVLIRQARYEAWDQWKVSAFIAAIPALLEISLVLFLSGIVVVAWRRIRGHCAARFLCSLSLPITDRMGFCENLEFCPTRMEEVGYTGGLAEERARRSQSVAFR
ncbi:hypothetical protein NM688_g9374 [Phlebia brevispora]|uniref:Uncharacterized protein n=1 Tax=Phlebia brevispora TaxID=194682 RepID=A0ACC1RIA1_9APHY|nr:hypothetical protein NM688_g9374 [Phlebia brevispora]